MMFIFHNVASSEFKFVQLIPCLDFRVVFPEQVSKSLCWLKVYNEI
jgi:hypothetical protein